MSSNTAPDISKFADAEEEGEYIDLTNNRDSEEEDLFAEAPENDEPVAKRARVMESSSNGEASKADPVLLEHAKQRLSKWAARLFDPNRPRGLVEARQIIPLNDEFLSAFGKREKEFDKAAGRHKEVDQTIESDEEDEVQVLEDTSQQNKTSSRKSKKSASRTKVKVTNLAYRTSEATLTQACEQFGPLVEVHLVLDKERQKSASVQNSGRGYITFEHADDAQSCIDNLAELDGRPLRLNLALEKPKSNSGAGPKSASSLNRYWDKDISTVCYRCGQVGHIEPNCTNPAKPKPCALCASLDHEQKFCPCNRICFNCGIPGHVSRDCTLRRGLPRRMICGICFQQGHHRLQCRAGSYVHSAPANNDAICMQCKQPGHFLCKNLKWFYGLEGISCFNCGSQGHSGYDCRRPNLFQCLQDPELTAQEIDRATANSMAEQMEEQRQQRGRQRGRNRERGGSNNRNHAKSMPPSRSNSGSDNRRRSSGGGSKRGYNNTGGKRPRG